jgi:hypothetical protein
VVLGYREAVTERRKVMPFKIDNTQVPTPDAPASDYFAVVPSDTVAFTRNVRGLYIGSAGNVVAVTLAGTAVTFTGVPAGTFLPIEVLRVNATGTTAGSIVGLV